MATRICEKVERLNEMVKSRYGFQIPFDANAEHLRDVCRLYDQQRQMLLVLEGERNAMKNPRYAKAVLISEAVRMFLREIAPRRSKKKRK